MVLCFIALPVFAILGIFSLKYRHLAKDALNCLFKTVTLRKCESGLDDRIKSGIAGTLLKFSPRTAGFVYKHYKFISWVVLILFTWSAIQGGIGTYNLIQYGNCYGPEETGFCVFDPLGAHSGCSEIHIEKPKVVKYPEVQADDPIIGPENAELTIIEFGCYVCEFTAKAEPVIKEVIDHYDGKVNFQFQTIVIPDHKYSYTASLAAGCAQEQGKYKEFHELIFEQKEVTNESLNKIAEEIGLNMEQYDQCMKEEKYKERIERDTQAGTDAGIQGTPTFFVGEQTITGPKPFKTFKKLIDKELKT